MFSDRYADNGTTHIECRERCGFQVLSIGLRPDRRAGRQRAIRADVAMRSRRSKVFGVPRSKTRRPTPQLQPWTRFLPGSEFDGTEATADLESIGCRGRLSRAWICCGSRSFVRQPDFVKKPYVFLCPETTHFLERRQPAKPAAVTLSASKRHGRRQKVRELAFFLTGRQFDNSTLPPDFSAEAANWQDDHHAAVAPSNGTSLRNATTIGRGRVGVPSQAVVC